MTFFVTTCPDKTGKLNNGKYVPKYIVEHYNNKGIDCLGD